MSIEMDECEEDIENVYTDLSDVDSNADDDFYIHDLDIDVQSNSTISSIETNRNDVRVGNSLQTNLRYFIFI